MTSMIKKATGLPRADFIALQTATPEDLAIIRKAEVALFDELPGRIIEHLQLLESVPNGHIVCKLQRAPTRMVVMKITWSARYCMTLAMYSVHTTMLLLQQCCLNHLSASLYAG